MRQECLPSCLSRVELFRNELNEIENDDFIDNFGTSGPVSRFGVLCAETHR